MGKKEEIEKVREQCEKEKDLFLSRRNDARRKYETDAINAQTRLIIARNDVREAGDALTAFDLAAEEKYQEMLESHKAQILAAEVDDDSISCD